MSHSITGEDGDVVKNCDKAKRVVHRLRKVFPEIKWYCPAEANLVLHILWDKEQVSIEQILDADLEILRACSNWFWWKTSESYGCHIEEIEAENLGWINAALDENVIYTDLTKANFSEIRRIFTPIVEAAKERFHA